MSRWLATLRLSLFPTVCWDVIAGAWLAGSVLTGKTWLIALVVTLVWSGGMALNDFADKEIDQMAKRNRPLAKGELTRIAVFSMAAGLLSLALLLTRLWLPHLQQPITLLIGMVVIYDLGGPLIRRSIGPLLLALCRAFALAMGGLLHLSPSQLLQSPGPWPYLAYAMYVLFLARLAQREESGGKGMGMLPYMVGACMAPLLLLQKTQSSLMVFLAWIVLAWFILRGPFRLRHDHWSPKEVQFQVRRALFCLPIVPGIALLSYGFGLMKSLTSLGVMLLVFVGLKKFPPE
jgi:4-hydroxybenzoate polyprenyltransferase